MATKNIILGTVPKSRGRYTEGDTTTKWYYDNILEYKGSSFRCINETSTGITGAPATYNANTHTLVPNAGWEFFVDNTGVLDISDRLNGQSAETVKLDEYTALNNVDYIVEEGENYRKWNSGILEQWGIDTVLSTDSQYSSIIMPVAFTNTNYVVIGSIREQLNGYIFITPDSNDSQVFRFRVTDSNNAVLTSKVSWIAKGFWK